MSSCTDPLGLNEKKLFKVLKDGLSKGAKETRNILAIRDDILYVWNEQKCCIFTLNVAATRGNANEDIPYQTLLLTDSPIFEVTNMLINETITQLTLWGNLGIVVVELPKRWGKGGAFQGGKDVVSCVSNNLDELGTVEIRQARWHPGSPNYSHLLVLTSENNFRLYECVTRETPKLIKKFSVGKVPSQSPSKIPNFASLGETAVDFDFATPTLRANADKGNTQTSGKIGWSRIDWPVLVLRGNGEVLLVHGDLMTHSLFDPVVLGPLTIYPPANDNYGIDSCSIMCIDTMPPIVIIATCTGKIYHSILLRTEMNEHFEEKKNSSQGSLSLYSPEDTPDTLYVFECVEMELGLLYTDEDKKYSCPIHLSEDKGNKSRYFCSHNAGIHTISLPIVSQLEEFVEANEEREDLFLPSLSNQSSSQYLVCTRTKHTDKEEATPVLGFDLIREPCFLIALLHTGVVVDLSLVDLRYIPKIEAPEPISSPSKKVTKEPFDAYIKKLLMHKASQPITKLSLQQKQKTSKEIMELLFQATTIFRTEYFGKHDKVRAEIAKKVQTLKTLKTHQFKELDILMETKKELKEAAEHLAERYEDIKDKQEELARRAEEVLRLVKQREPSMTAAERAEAEDIQRIEGEVNELAVRMKQLQMRRTNQSQTLKSCCKDKRSKEIVISAAQTDAIKSQLTAMTRDISDLVAHVKVLEDDLDI